MRWSAKIEKNEKPKRRKAFPSSEEKMMMIKSSPPTKECEKNVLQKR